jgi:hypothetical protein
MKNELHNDTEYVVVSLNGQNGPWYKSFTNKEDAEEELNKEHYEFGDLELMSLEDFMYEYESGEGEEYEWNDELDAYIQFP